MYKIINSENCIEWRSFLEKFDKLDVCHTPEYHNAYISRLEDSKALMWCYESNGNYFAYPFLMAPIYLSNENKKINTEYFDISGVYGFSGPLSSTEERSFLDEAWSLFDEWAHKEKIICEFLRFSVYADNTKYVHKDCEILENRPISISLLPSSEDEYLSQLNSKTRNMIRRAWREGLEAKELNVKEYLGDFINLYTKTMERNQATNFFSYDDTYYNHLLSLPENEISLHGVYQDGEMVAVAMGLIVGEYAFYHLGASDKMASRIGAGNLVLFDLALGFMRKGVKYFNVGGGRSTAMDDALFKFKKSNGTSVVQYYIGKRILDEKGYDDVSSQWKKFNQVDEKINNLQFYR